MNRLTRALVGISALSLITAGHLRAQAVADAAFVAAWTPISTITANSDTVGGDSLVFKNGVRFNTGLYGVRLLGVLPAYHKAPYLVLVGVGCLACDGEDEVAIQSPTDGPVRYDTHVSYLTPGPQYRGYTDPPDTQPIARVRTFIGRCLPSMTQGVVWFVVKRDSAGWHSRVHVVDVVSDHLRARDLGPPLPRLQALAPQVRAGACRELIP